MWNAYNHYMPPNTQSCAANNNFYITPYGEFMDAIPPSSNHPGGINASMSDCSTRFIKNTISSGISNAAGNSIVGNAGVFQAISTRNMGEVVSADAY